MTDGNEASAEKKPKLRTQAELIKELTEAFYKRRRSLIGLAVVMFVWAGLMAITVIGLIVAWVPLLAGVKLIALHSDLSHAYAEGQMQVTKAMMEKLSSAIPWVVYSSILVSFLVGIKIIAMTVSEFI